MWIVRWKWVELCGDDGERGGGKDKNHMTKWGKWGGGGLFIFNFCLGGGPRGEGATLYPNIHNIFYVTLAS